MLSLLYDPVTSRVIFCHFEKCSSSFWEKPSPLQLTLTYRAADRQNLPLLVKNGFGLEPQESKIFFFFFEEKKK